MSVLNIWRKLVLERHGQDINPDELEPDDPKVFETIRNGNTDGLFQIESPGMKKMFKGINNVTFETLIAGVSLYRPGPMDYIPEYQSKANGYTEIEPVHSAYDDITRNTFGIMIYQEQVMQVSQRMAGYSAGEADILRKAVGKKKKEILEPALEELSKRMLNQGVNPAVAKKICDDIRPFAGYAFNRSHAAAYAYIAYQTAYAKTYYPLEFMTALLTVFFDKEEKVATYIKDAKEMSIQVLPPDINKSGRGFTIDGSAIRFGLGAIKKLGDAALTAIEDYRPFTSLKDIAERVPRKGLNKTNLRALSKSGALDTFMEEEGIDNRLLVFEHLLATRGDVDENLTLELSKYTHKQKLEDEKEFLGIFVSGHPLERHTYPVNWEGLNDKEVVDTAAIVLEVKEIFTKKEQWMAILSVDTMEGPKRFVVFPDTYGKARGTLVKDLIIKVKVYFNTNWQRNERDIIVKDIAIPKRINKEVLSKLQNKINNDSPTQSLEDMLSDGVFTQTTRGVL